MQNPSSTKNPADTDTAGAHHHLFAAPPAFLCALPADLARLRPQFMAEPDDHGDAHHEAQ